MSAQGTKARPQPRKNPSLHNPGKKRKLKLQLDIDKLLQYRVDGLTYAEIGKKMGCSDAWAHMSIMKALDRLNEDIKEKIPQARQIELNRCDNYLKALLPKCRKGDTGAIMTAMKVAERRSRLCGLDAPVKIDPLAGEGGALAVELFRKMVEDAGASQ